MVNDSIIELMMSQTMYLHEIRRKNMTQQERDHDDAITHFILVIVMYVYVFAQVGQILQIYNIDIFDSCGIFYLFALTLGIFSLAYGMM